MKVIRIDATDAQIADTSFPGWQTVKHESFPMVPTPLKGNPAVKKISPFIEKSTDHGTVTAVDAAAAHNGHLLAVRLRWASGKHDKIVDLDEFVDGAAVMFPLTANASAVLMGSETDPVNAWYWKGNLEKTGFDVIARGYGTSGRRNDERFPISCSAYHDNGHWHIVLSRALKAAADRVHFTPGAETRVAFAVWDGGNRERSGRKSFSGEFMRAPIDA